MCNSLPRWHLTISSDQLSEPYERDEDEIENFQNVVELGPDWTAPNYKITITYNWATTTP